MFELIKPIAVDIYNFSELFSLTIILLLNIIIIIKLSKFFKITIKEGFFLYVWHTIFAVFFIILDLNHGHDANGWYTRGHLEKIGFYSNDFMYFLTGLLKFLKIKYLAQNFIFNLLGTVVLMIFYSSVKEYCKFENNKKFLRFNNFILLPGLSFDEWYY